jgi:hypothetical protein
VLQSHRFDQCKGSSGGYSPKAAKLVAAIVTPATVDNDLGELRFPRAQERNRLERAKLELKHQFGRE